MPRLRALSGIMSVKTQKNESYARILASKSPDPDSIPDPDFTHSPTRPLIHSANHTNTQAHKHEKTFGAEPCVRNPKSGWAVAVLAQDADEFKGMVPETHISRTVPVRDGWARMAISGGAVYEGDVRGGVPEGKGRAVFSDGSVYVGSWVRGVQEGDGRFRWEDGDEYEGDFR